MNPPPFKAITEAALLSAGQPLSVDRLLALFPEEERPAEEEIRGILETLAAEWEGRPLELRHVGSGFRFQVRSELAPWMGRLSEERQPRYSRALLETLALIVYRQPITRAGIEEIRGVSVSSQIIRTLLEREWIRVVGHRDVPGKPALFGTTKAFLDYFNLHSLSDLPPLAEIRPLDHLQEALDLFAAGDSPDPAATDAPVDSADAAVRDEDEPGEQDDDAGEAEDAERPAREARAEAVETA